MQSIEAEGNSIDDAIARALSLLGAPRERVEIEILANATRGLFGFGGKPARVRASLRRPVTDAEIPTPTPTPSPAPHSAAAPATPSPNRPSPSRPSAPARAARSRERRPPSRERRSVPRDTARRPTPDTTPPSPESLERGRTLLAEIVQHCGIEGTVETVGTRLVIHGDTGGVMIGRRGATLDALEYVVNRAVGHDEERASHIEVDANDYRGRRRAALEALARRMAERARSKGKPVALNPLNPRERRVVHLVLQGDPTLTTRSAGSGFYRRLVIVPIAPRAQA
jgi:spoIIIJ-associated protein